MGRNELYEKLQRAEIYTRKYFYPLTSDQKCFENRYERAEVKYARELAEKVLVLTLYETLTKKSRKDCRNYKGQVLLYN